MAKQRSEKLHIVRMLAERKESRAAMVLQEQQKKLASENAYLSQIDSYYQDYLTKMGGQISVSADELLRYRSFSQQLADSIQKIQRKINHTVSAVERAQHEWVLLRHKRKAIDDLIKRAKTEEQLAEDKKDQKVLDELVNQKSLRDGQEQQREH